MAVASVFTCMSPSGPSCCCSQLFWAKWTPFSMFNSQAWHSVFTPLLRAWSTLTDKYVLSHCHGHLPVLNTVHPKLQYELCLWKGFSTTFVPTHYALPKQVCRSISFGHLFCSIMLLTGILSSLFTKKWLVTQAGQKWETTQGTTNFLYSDVVSYLFLLPVHSNSAPKFLHLTGRINNSPKINR